jgi:hypothetical protein
MEAEGSAASGDAQAMLAPLLLAAAVSAADLQQWIDDQPDVRAYEMRRATLQPPPEGAFRQAPRLPQGAACESRSEAMRASVLLFKTADESKLTLTEPDLLNKNDGQPVLQLNDDGKKALTDRAAQYEQEAGRYEPACLG